MVAAADVAVAVCPGDRQRLLVELCWKCSTDCDLL